jgi:rare lipoprotein A
LIGCATPETSHSHAVHHVPYVKFSQTGYASFYGHGDGFNGKRMANGEKFHAANIHLAAHPTLPLGTKLKVIDLKNKKILYVEVTDRMGHVHNRIIDLSYAAAKYFKMQGRGLVKVRIKTVTDKEYNRNIGL